MNRRLASYSVVLAGLMLAGCAAEQPPINRVQPNFYDKAFFVGADYTGAADDPEFYSRATVVDVGYGAGQDGLFTSTYAQPMTRVKWTITEDLLVARLAYERIAGADGKGLGIATNNGIVVAAYKIQSHFDIKRSYNPATGEQTNVIEENSIDRPWFQRQYIRVDWSKNLSTDNYDFDTLSQMGVYGGISYEPLAYSITDPQEADAPHVDSEVGYLDITNKAFAKPQMVDLSMWGFGAFPACWLDADIKGGTSPTSGCSPVELTIRQAFLKVKDHDYEPADWDGFRFQAFGAFTVDRFGYARDYGMTDTQWHRFIDRYNIWDRSHFYTDPTTMTGQTACFTPNTTPVGADPHRDLNKDGTEDECASVGRGSRCDTFKQRCTLPFRDRQVKPIAWFYTEGSHPDFFEPTRDATHEWDVAMRSAVMTARYAECMRTGEQGCATSYPVYTGGQEDNWDAIQLSHEVDDCRQGLAYAGQDCLALADSLGAARGLSPGIIALAKEPEMIVLCHSPVENNDPAGCGDKRLPAGVTAAQCTEARNLGATDLINTCSQATSARLGDLRFHTVNALVAPQTPSPWGIMVDADDPLTGEKVTASINVWTHVNDLWSQMTVDTARYIKGELTTADVTEGTYVKDWASAAEASSNGSLPKFTDLQRDDLVAGLTHGNSAEIRANMQAFRDSPVFAQVQALQKDLSQVKADALAPTTSRPVYEARRKHALNTQTEAAITTPMMQSWAGTSALMDSDTVTALSSPLRGANPSSMRDFRNAREMALADRGACIMNNEAPAPLAIADLANILEAKFGPFQPGADKGTQLAHAEVMRKYLARRAHYAVIIHEMGHSIALRHNFVSSADAWNYRPQYWQLRTNDGAQTTACTTLDPTGACVGPRYWDPLTKNERDNLIPMFMQSSVMDYAGETTQDTIGLGSYDFAAARMFYGDVAAVFAGADYKAGTPKAGGTLSKLDSFGGIVGITFSKGVGNSNNPVHYSQLQKEFGMITNCQPVDPQIYKPATWNDTTMGTFNPVWDALIVKVNGQYTKCQSMPLDYVNWSTLRDSVASDGAAAASAVDPANRTRFPYGFATDRWADLGNLSVYRHDNGADPYELFDFLITQQEVNHIFDNYRRNRQTFSVRNASNRTLSRYNEKLRDAAKGLSLYANIYKDFAVAQGYDYETLWPYITTAFFPDNILASGIGFDHFSKQMSRPEAGPHYIETVGTTKTLRSAQDSAGNAGTTKLIIPNGATGYYGNVGFGGRLMENQLSSNHGEYDSEYTINCGSYYDKAWASMLMTESVDNFISASRRDFLDARYRSVSVADLMPDGYRRWLSNNLTGDDELKGARIATGTTGSPLVDVQKYPQNGIGYTQWWTPTVASCFPSDSALSCTTTPTNTMVIDPQVGWEQQKFLIAYTLLYLPENKQQTWLDQMGIWELGADTDPGFPNRIELHLPNGKVYIAKTFGHETIFGKSVQKGIAARMLEYANQLLAQAYVVTNAPDADGDGNPDWYIPTLVNGLPVVKYDPSIQIITPQGNIAPTKPGCDTTDNSTCTCTQNRACTSLSGYEELPFFMRQAMRDYGVADPTMKGIY